MIDAMAAGLAILSPSVLLYSLIGIMVSSVVSFLPGLGGAFTLALILPFTFGLEPVEGIAMLTGAIVVTSTANTITACLFGVPGDSSSIPTTFDGYPMAQRGEGGRAVGAGLMACLWGGILGAIALAIVLPFARPLITNVGPAEFFALLLIAIVLISQVQDTKLSKNLVSAGLGCMAAYVGIEEASSQHRFTFGALYLFDGIPLLPVVIGLFAVAEMISLGRQGGPIADLSSGRIETGVGVKGVLTGCWDTVRLWRTTVLGSIVGVIVGIIPGLGSSTAAFAAYARAAAMSKSEPRFGKGNVEGVISSDAATNSKDGGAFIPTLMFGIPGSPNMAIVLAAIIGMGVYPGQDMLTTNLDILWMIVWLMVVASVIGTTVSLLATPPLSRLTVIDSELIIPPVLLLGLWGAYSASFSLHDILLAAGVGVLGYILKEHGYSRATFVIAFVLAPLLEHYWILSSRLYGPEFIFRPITLALLLIPVPVAILLHFRRRGRRGELKSGQPTARID